MIQSISKNQTFTCEGIWFFKIACRFFLMLVSIPSKCTTNLVGGFYLWRKCWNSAFNAQGWRVSIVIVQVRAVKILCDRERQDETQFTTKTKLFRFCKIFIPSYTFDGLLCRNWPISPPDHLTLLITLALERKNPWVKTFYRIWIGLQ